MKGDIGKRKFQARAEFQIKGTPDTFVWYGKFNSWENAKKQINTMAKTWHLVQYHITPITEE